MNNIFCGFNASIKKCSGWATIEVNAQTENVNIDGKLNVQKNICAQ